MSAAATPSSRTIRWIANLPFDSALFIGTPLLIVPLILGIAFFVADENVFLVISTFGAMGHHAPGLMRAYGDRKLFRRFWLRFTIVPVVTLSTFLMFSLQQLPGVTLILVFWSMWHFMMQTYGFGRIYDAKVGATEVRNHHLDFAFCVAWTGLCVLYAPGRVSDIVALALKSGVTSTASIPVSSFRLLWTVGTAAITAIFLADLSRRMATGRPVNPAKLLLFTVTFSFFWLCDVGIRNLVLGIAMLELFHDVQYLAIVWLFNRSRADKDPSAGTFTRFLFRPGFAGLYIGIVVAYGFVAFAGKTLASDTFQHVLLSVIATSNVLHFYYDGFIWKVREPETREALGVDESGGPVTSVRQRISSLRQKLAHPAKWAVLLTILAGLMAAERRSPMTELDQARAVVDRVPDSSSARIALAQRLLEAKDYDGAIAESRAASQLGRPDYRIHKCLGIALAATGQPASGHRELERAFELHPDDPQLRFHLAMGYIRTNQRDLALQHLTASVELDPEDPITRYNLGVLYIALGNERQAVDALRTVIRLNPDFAEAYRPLGESLLSLGETEAALQAFRDGVKRNPDDHDLAQRLKEAQAAPAVEDGSRAPSD
ncbi:MAG: tetratricopeptide repeat protein [Planctomycetaceae bacterium]